MRVLLIEPPFQRFMGFKCDWFPLGLGYLGAVLRERGHDVLIYNAEFHHQPQYLSSSRLLDTFDNYLRGLRNDGHPIWQEATTVMAGFDPGLVGITVRSVKLASALVLARLAKAHRSDVPIVFGGQHPSIMTDAVLDQPEVDFVVRGEGEATLAELVAALEGRRLALASGRGLAAILGLSYRRDGKIVHNPPRPLLEDIDTLPLPARTALYDHDAYGSEAMGNLFTARGCPFSCGYCSAHQIWTRQVRYRSLDSVVAEIRQVCDTYGTKQFTIWDDSFTANRQRVLELCRRLHAELPGSYWSCTTRFDLIDEELVVAMKAAGCNNIELGVESGSQPVLDFINKGLTLDQIREGARLLNKHGLYWSAFFMVGIPNERREDVLATLRFMRELRPHWATYSVFTPYPGTPLFEAACQLGLASPDQDYSRFGHQSPHNAFTAYIAPAEMAELLRLTATEFDRYNRAPARLVKKALSRVRIYLGSPREAFGDARKLANWLGVAKRA